MLGAAFGSSTIQVCMPGTCCQQGSGWASGVPITSASVAFARNLDFRLSYNADIRVGVTAPRTMVLAGELLPRLASFYFSTDGDDIPCQGGGSPPSTTCDDIPPKTFYARFGSVKGRVVDRSGVPVGEGVSVTAYAADSLTVAGQTTARTVLTDADSNYDFTTTSAGQLLNENNLCPPASDCTDHVSVERGNSWGLLLCGDPIVPGDTVCRDGQPVTRVATRDFHLVAGYDVVPPDDPNRVPVTPQQQPARREGPRHRRR
jgi:hypothetical protein